MAQLIGTAANQVPLNGMLGNMAFQDKAGVSVDNITSAGSAIIQGLTSATSTTTGALQVAGGVGIGGNLYVGGTLIGIATTASNIAGGTQYQIPYQSNPGQTTFSSIFKFNGTSLILDGYSGAGGNSIEANGGVGVTGSGTMTFGRTSYGFLDYNTSNPAGVRIHTFGGDSSQVGSFSILQRSGDGGIIRAPFYINTLSQTILGSTTSPPPTTTNTATVVINGSTYISTSTNASSTNTGALQVAGGVGIGGDLYSGGIVSGKILAGVYQDKVTAVTANTVSTSINLSLNNSFVITISASTTISFTSPPAGTDITSFTLITVNDGTGGYAISWPASVTWAGGVTPTRTTTANKSDVYTFFTRNAGTQYVGSLAVLNY